MKYKEIIKIIKNISLALPDVQSFYTGDVYEVNADQSVKYSSVVLTNQEHQFDNINDKFQYNFILFYIDRLTDDEANRTDVHTAAVSALKNIVQHLEDYNVIINDFKFNLFRERFNDSCAGAYATLSVDVEDNDCNEDFDFTYGQISADKLKEISITTNGTYTPDEGYYYTKIDVNVQPQLQNKSVNINENGQRTVEADSDYDGLKKVNLNVDIQPPLQSKSVEINENGTSKITADSDYYGIKDIDINVNVPIPEYKSSALFATENNKWYIASDEGLDGYEAVNVSVPEPKLVDHTAIYVENGSYSLTPKNADGFSSVNVRVDVPNPQLTVLNATENGHYEAVDSGFYGYQSVYVNVPIPEFTTGQMRITENGIYRASQQGVDGFDAVEVDVPTQEFTTEELNATENGEYTPSTDGYSKVNVNVQPSLQSKSVEITSNGTSTITADSDYYGLESVDINVNINIPTFQTEELTVRANGVYTPNTDGFSKVTVDTYDSTDKFVVPNGMKFGNSVFFNKDYFDVSNVIDMSFMFAGNSFDTNTATLDLSGWNCSSATTMQRLFYGSKYTEINLDNMVTSGVTDMSFMFSGASKMTSLSLNNVSTTNVKDMQYMFQNCTVLENLDLSSFDTSKVTTMVNMFSQSALSSLNLSTFRTNLVRNTSYMFYNCSDLNSLDLSTLNFNSVTTMHMMFQNCTSLRNLIVDSTILPKINLNTWGLSTCTALTIVSLESVLNALPQLPDGTSYTCSLGSTNLAKLTDEQIAIATNKNWVLS